MKEIIFRIGEGADYDWIDYWDDYGLELMEQFDPVVRREFHIEWIDTFGNTHIENYYDSEIELQANYVHHVDLNREPSWIMQYHASKWSMIQTKPKALLIFSDDALAVQIKLLDVITMFQVDG